MLAAALFSALVGAVTFTGSMLAFAKLQELMPGRPITFAGQQLVNAALIVAALVFACRRGVTEARSGWSLLLVGLARLRRPVRAADRRRRHAGRDRLPERVHRPLGAVAAGFVLGNNALIIGGTLVGASGTLLTLMMGRAMNRSVTNVLFGAFGAAPTGTAAAVSADGRTVREVSPDDLAVMLAYAKQVMIVPGYGLAVAQAQHAVARAGGHPRGARRHRPLRHPPGGGTDARAT